MVAAQLKYCTSTSLPCQTQSAVAVQGATLSQIQAGQLPRAACRVPRLAHLGRHDLHKAWSQHSATQGMRRWPQTGQTLAMLRLQYTCAVRA